MGRLHLEPTEFIKAHEHPDDDLRIGSVVFESLEGIIVTDARGVIVRVNRSFTKMTGYDAVEVIGKTPKLFQSGRHDAGFYLSMWRTIRKHGVWQDEIWNRRKNGELYPVWLTIKAVPDHDGTITHYVGTSLEISNLIEAESKIFNLAFYDPLTNLPNRRLLMDRLRHTLAASIRTKHKRALLFIDLDQFKVLNDTLGHAVGDQLLQDIANRLTTCVREGDTVARLGGDEFVVILNDLDAKPEDAADQARTVGRKILAAARVPCRISNHEMTITLSIGITLFGGQRVDIDELMKQADIAMYRAKTDGRNRLRFFDPALQTALKARASIEEDLREGIKDGQFMLYFQPQIHHTSLIGAEALIRWRHPRRGLVSPGEFIPVAEETGLILALGRWVLEAACGQLVAWSERPELADITLSVNVSAKQFLQANFVGEVSRAIECTGANPKNLKLELTESMLVDNVGDIIVKMTTLKSLGISFSLDDFGTGYSSLSYLKRLPLDQLKIDQSFVRDVLTDQNDAVIARTIVSLGQNLGLKVIAEGVETEAQRDFLASHGCHTYQGYLFGRPLPLEEFQLLVPGCDPTVPTGEDHSLSLWRDEIPLLQ